MRMMFTLAMDVHTSNEAVKTGVMKKTFETLMKKMQPESAYFYAVDGQRGAQFVFDMKDTSELPPLAELAFHNLGAQVEFVPVMNQQELERGLEAWAKAQG